MRERPDDDEVGRARPLNEHHAVPTGDLFRRLEVGGEVVGDSGDVIDSALPRALTRSFRTQLSDAGADRIPLADTRVPPPGGAPPREVVLRFLPETATRAISWRVSYLRMESEMAHVFGRSPSVSSTTPAVI